MLSGIKCAGFPPKCALQVQNLEMCLGDFLPDPMVSGRPGIRSELFFVAFSYSIQYTTLHFALEILFHTFLGDGWMGG